MSLPDRVSDFLHDESAGAAALLVGTLAALLWANSPAGDAYSDVWTTKLGAGFLELDLRHWVNDGLMAMFFFVIGLEIKRELITGELQDRRAAALPALAALGGVVLPVAVFLAVVGGGSDAAGWAIPAATDIAFAVGVLTLLGDRASDGARLLLLSIAIVDDVIAIVIIAVAYSKGTSLAWLGAAVALVLVLVLMRRAGVARIAPYVPVGVALWLAVHESGVHATIAGVVLGLLTPARPVRGRDVLEVLEHRLHPVSAFAVVPLFALANAGIDLRGGVLQTALSSSLAWAIVAGLVVGKLVGVVAAARAAVATGAGALPDGVGARDLVGVGALAGIGFTVSLFIASLAFDSARQEDVAKVGIFAGSLVSALVGAGVWLSARGRRRATARP